MESALIDVHAKSMKYVNAIGDIVYMDGKEADSDSGYYRFGVVHSKKANGYTFVLDMRNGSFEKEVAADTFHENIECLSEAIKHPVKFGYN